MAVDAPPAKANMTLNGLRNASVRTTTTSTAKPQPSSVATLNAVGSVDMDTETMTPGQQTT